MTGVWFVFSYCVVGSICYSAKVVITDLDEFVPLMQLNIAANRHLLKGSVSAEALAWGLPASGHFSFPHYILLADCIYYEAVCFFHFSVIYLLSIFMLCTKIIQIDYFNFS